ncbi:hypothetical protein JYQ62_31670 [Nostoc sp. UHCC 0702]|nr:hypothetical protein JYQ62_31670 [Nostoc sp. UHCC 0702]
MSINIARVEQAIGIFNFKRTDLLEIALTHPSRIYENRRNRELQDKQEREYRRLAILGDTILSHTVIGYLYEKYPDFNQEIITNIKSEIVRRVTCYKFAKQLNLKGLSLLGGSEQQKHESQQQELFGEMFEALIGAIYVEYDSNFSLARDWLIKHFIKSTVDALIEENQILEELPVDYSQAISTMNATEKFALLRQMKEEADALVAQNVKLQTLLSWIHQKSSLADSKYKPTQTRAFYLALIRIFALGFVRNCDPTVNSNSQVRNFFDSFNRVNALGLELSFKFNSTSDPANVIASILLLDIEPELKQALQQLKDELPKNPRIEQEKLEQWRQINGQDWLNKIQDLIGYDLVFNESQKELLKEYYKTNLVLMDLINNLSAEEKQLIEDTLFLYP